MSRNTWLAAAALLATGMAQATCFSVYKADGTLVHQTPNPPVNLSLPLGDTVPEKYGAGATMTVSELGYFCREQRGAALAANAAVPAAREDADKSEGVAIKQLSGPVAGPFGGAAAR